MPRTWFVPHIDSQVLSHQPVHLSVKLSSRNQSAELPPDNGLLWPTQDSQAFVLETGEVRKPSPFPVAMSQASSGSASLCARQLLCIERTNGAGPKCLSLQVQFSSVAQSRLTLCDPMDCSTPGFPVHHQLSFSLLSCHVGRAVAAWLHCTWKALSTMPGTCVHAQALQLCLTLHDPAERADS